MQVVVQAPLLDANPDIGTFLFNTSSEMVISEPPMVAIMVSPPLPDTADLVPDAVIAGMVVA